MTTKINWTELHSVPVKEIKKQYKLSDRQLENTIRRHMDGASLTERSQLYKDIYKKDK